mgnify:CR=1 FL=1
MRDVAIIGGGPAGLTAAIYTLRAGLSTTIFDKGLYGGQAAITSEIENYPAILKISGADFAMRLYEQATSLGAELLFEEVEGLDLNAQIKIIKTKENEYPAKTVIIASGAKRRTLGCEGEAEFFGRGVSYCATCDGAFFEDKDIAVIGGGNTALEDALFLANICNSVTLIHRRDSFRAQKFLVDAVIKNEKISILYHHIVEKIQGKDRVSSLQIKDLNKSHSRKLNVNAIFIAIGLIPDTNLFKGLLPLDQSGYFITDESCTSKIPGVYIAGDCRKKPLRQIVTACSDGAISAFGAATYLNASSNWKIN